MEYAYEQSLNEFSDLKHVEWLANHIDEYTYTESGLEIRNRLFDAISKKNTFYDVCESSYKEFTDCFNNNPYDYQIGLFEKKSIETDHPGNYFVLWDYEGVTYTVPIGYLMENAHDNDYREARTKILCHWRECKKDCRELIERISSVRRQGRDYALFLAQVFGPNLEQSKTIQDYKRELMSDTLLCFLLCGTYLYCFRESGMVDLVKKVIGGSMGQVVSMMNGNIGMIIKIIGMILIGYKATSFAIKVFWKTFISKRLSQLHKYCKKTLEYDAVFQQIEKILADDITNEDRVLEKHEYGKDICDALRFSMYRFSTRFTKEKNIEQYVGLYRGISKNIFWYIPLCFLITVFL